MARYRIIQEMHAVDKPREKMIKYGPHKLSSEELLAIILRTGTRGKSAIHLARKILAAFEDELPQQTIDQLKKIDGIGTAKACEIIATFELGKRFLAGKESQLILGAEDIWEACEDIRKSKKEHFVVFFLDARNQQIKRELISVGTLTSSLVHPREVFEPAVKFTAAHIILAHNHPSGGLEPSVADIAITRQLRAAGKILGIEVLDHVIVTEKSWYSLRENDEMSLE